jgi:hypothetical protein
MLPAIDFDGPWKEFLDAYLPEIMAFFFRDAHDDIDWSRGYTPLDTTLQQVAPSEETGKQAVDKLMQVWLHGGTEAHVFIHLEVQSQTDMLFTERMFRYHARLFDHYRHPIVSFAILGDDRPSWRPHRFEYDRWGCALNLTFPTVKLLDFDRAALEADPNPCATIVLAHLDARATRNDPEARARAKLALVRRLYRLGYDREQIIRLFRFIEWLLRLPEALEERTLREIRALEEEVGMTYITYGERRGEARGIEIGEARGLWRAISLGLELKFGSAGDALMPEIRAITDVALLQSIVDRLRTATALDEVRAVYASGA